MANHGYCKNCWWYQQTKNRKYKIEDGKLREIIGEGICYMHSVHIGIVGAEYYKYESDNNYCPDYCNRKKIEKTDGTLEEWIKSCYEEWDKR